MRVEFKSLKQAMEMGCYLSAGNNRYRLYWPSGDVELFGTTPDDLITEMKELQNDSLYQRMMKVAKKEDATHINGIPTSGAIAYKEGVPASDCPYMEEDPDFSRWNNEWDDAADQEMEKEKSERPKPLVGSIITNRYRAVYSESGHPTHCGDALATLLNTMCVNKAGTNMELFEAICAANGVDLSKYNRTSKGWQGRLRMTGRNLLAKKVKENGGKLMMPKGLGQEYFQLGPDWVEEAVRKFKPKTEQT